MRSTSIKIKNKISFINMYLYGFPMITKPKLVLNVRLKRIVLRDVKFQADNFFIF